MLTTRSDNSIASRGTWGFRLRMVCACLGLLQVLVVSACSESPPSDPFLVHDAGPGGGGTEGDAGTDTAFGEGGESGMGPDDELGRPCLDDGQCDDEIDCTIDTCDLKFERCRHATDDELCQDDIYCDGREVCDTELGCVEGAAVSCSDDRTCTIDLCIEDTRSCEHAPRDADGDGDGVWNCGDGGDCNDQNPNVSSLRDEVCGNGVDDDCDQEVDEEDCASPEHDRCDDALEIEESGSYALSFTAASGDYTASCVADSGARVDVVADLVVPEGPARDLDVAVYSDSLAPALSLSRECGEPSSELACASARESEAGESVARLHAYSLAPGHYPVVVFADEQEGSASLKVRFEDAEDPPSNETCGSAAELEPGKVETLRPYAAVRDHEGACSADLGDLVYHFALTEASDVHLFANALDQFGSPVVSLRDSGCAPLESEITCRGRGPQTELFARALPPADYFVVVSEQAPALVSLLLETEVPSDAPPGDRCADAPELSLGESTLIDMPQYTEQIGAGCLAGAVDAALALDLTERADVLLIQSFSENDETALALASNECSESDTLVCSSSERSPLRTYAPAVPPGSYRVISESTLASGVRVSAFTRPSRDSTLVAFSDGCSDALEIPETGGRFVGNTASTNSDFGASCDFALSGPLGAPEQLLHLSLSQRRRMIFDMSGSEYATLLVVRAGPGCPGAELMNACAPRVSSAPSYLDLVLDPGDYYLQVDGYFGDSGPWQLDVFSAPI